jgi:hypothetical protein
MPIRILLLLFLFVVSFHNHGANLSQLKSMLSQSSINKSLSTELRFSGVDAAKNYSNVIADLTELKLIPVVDLELKDEQGQFLFQKLKLAKTVPLYTEKVSRQIDSLNVDKLKNGQLIYHPNSTLKVPDTTYEIFPNRRILKIVETDIDFSKPENLRILLDSHSIQTDKETIERTIRLNKEFAIDMYYNENEVLHRVILVPEQGFKTKLRIPEVLLTSEQFYKYSKQNKFNVIVDDFFKVKSNSVEASKLEYGSNQLSKSCNDSSLCKSFKKSKRMLLKAISYKRKSSKRKLERPSIAIVDQNIDPNHPFLNENNDVEILINNTNLSSCSPMEANHGTHIAGIISGYQDIDGIDSFIKSNLHYIDYKKRSGNRIIDSLNSIEQLDIVNLSIGVTTSNDKFLKETLRAHFKSNPQVLYVVAAGNENTPLDRSNTPLLLSFSDYKNIIAVTATDKSGTLIWQQSDKVGSNHTLHADFATTQSSRKILHVAAPGQNVPSACNSPRVGFLSGTSQAAALVTSAAAILVDEGLISSHSIKRRIIYSSDFRKGVRSRQYGGVLNISRMRDHKMDKICLKSETDKVDNHKCLNWKNVELVFEDENKKRLTKLALHYDQIKEPVIVKTRDLLRVFSHGRNEYSAMYLKEEDTHDAPLGRLFGIETIKAIDGQKVSVKYILKDGSKDEVYTIPLDFLSDYIKHSPEGKFVIG